MMEKTDSIGVFTDAEPDDMVALYILSKTFKIGLIVVNEGTALQAKAERVQKLYPDIPVECGWPSDKPFEECTVPTRTYDTYDIDNVTLDNCLVIMLSPMTGLVQQNPIVFSQATLWVYGSFNFRSTMTSLQIDTAVMQSFLESFKQTYIYESYHVTGEHNNLNPDVCSSMPDIHLIPGMTTIMHAWDTSLLNRLRSKAVSDPSRTNRDQKVIDQITASLGNQLVLADIGLSVTTKDDYVPCRVSFDPKTLYTQCTPCKPGESTVHMCRQLGFTEITQRLHIRLYSNRFMSSTVKNG